MIGRDRPRRSSTRALRLLLPMLLGTLLAVAAPTRADFLLSTEQTQEIPLQMLNIHETLSFERHDPVLGPLREVRILLEADLITTFEVTYGGTGDQTIDVIVDENVTLGLAVLSESPILSLALQVSERRTLTGPSDDFIVTKSDSGQTELVLNAPEDLLAFLGPGTVELDFVAIGTATFRENTGGGNRRIDSFSSGLVTIQYLYVPEPGSYALFALGSIGVLLAARARRSRSQRQ